MFQYPWIKRIVFIWGFDIRGLMVFITIFDGLQSSLYFFRAVYFSFSFCNLTVGCRATKAAYRLLCFGQLRQRTKHTKLSRSVCYIVFQTKNFWQIWPGQGFSGNLRILWQGLPVTTNCVFFGFFKIIFSPYPLPRQKQHFRSKVAFRKCCVLPGLYRKALYCTREKVQNASNHRFTTLGFALGSNLPVILSIIYFSPRVQ